MFPHQMFVVHSPYPDGTWRGFEKCAGTSAPLMFPNREDAENFLVAAELEPHFKVVEITLIVPSVHRALDSATLERVSPLIPDEG